MRTLAEVEDDICTAQWDLDAAKDHLQELEDERIRVEDHEAERRECKHCEGTGWINLDAFGDESLDGPMDTTCPACFGFGEVDGV